MERARNLNPLLRMEVCMEIVAITYAFDTAGFRNSFAFSERYFDSE